MTIFIKKTLARNAKMAQAIMQLKIEILYGPVKKANNGILKNPSYSACNGLQFLRELAP
jgi:hypothetical protein